MDRAQAYNLMTEMIQNQNLRRHALAVEAIMIALCRYLKNREHLKNKTSNSENGVVVDDSAKKIQLKNQGMSESSKKEFDEEQWGVVGLLHDADYELVEKDPSRHTLVTAEKLKELGVPDRIINGIKAHHDTIKPTRENLMESAVFAADELSGLITAVALIKDKKLSNVSVESVMRKFKEKNFAAGAKRESIASCEKELGIPLEEFIGIALKAMQGISDELGL